MRQYGMAKLPETIQVLEQRERAFIANYVSHGNGKKAAIDAGYPESVAKDWRNRLLASAHIAWAVAIETRRSIAEYAPIALQTLKDLAQNAKSEKVRGECAKHLLAIGGYVAPRSAIERSNADKPLHELSTTELQDMAGRLEDELAGRAKPVSSAIAAPSVTQAIDLIE